MSRMTDETALSRNSKTHQKGQTKEDTRSRYNEWTDYENFLQIGSIYNGPILVTGKVNDYVKDKDAKILDVGAGTGYVGQCLQKHGFTNIDALEPSDLWKLAESKNVYQNIYKVFYGFTEESHNIVPDGTYDVVAGSGIFGESHLPVDALDESIRILKSGGYFVSIIREEYLSTVEAYKDKFEPHMKDLEEEGYWKCVERSRVPNYVADKNGIVYVYQKL